MEKEIARWFEYAKKDLKNAKANFSIKVFDVCIFLCQQSVEKAFKAILLKKTGKIRKIHDLVALAKDIKFPESDLGPIKELTLAYAYTRYPDVIRNANLEEKAKEFINVSEEALKWVEKNL